MVTIEYAVGFLLAVVITASLVGLSLLGVSQAACVESASQLARHTARDDQAAVSQARSRAPEKAHIEITRAAEGVEATVSVDVTIVGLGPVTVTGQAWASYEPGVSP